MKLKTVSVVIPVYNEAPTIAQVLDRVRMAPTPGLKKQIVVVDDASSDGTARYLRTIVDDDIRCLFHERNRGKGAALRSGFAEATVSVAAKNLGSSTSGIQWPTKF